VSTTRTNPITADVIRLAIDGIDAIVTAEIHENYTGRGMTRPCVGVVVQSAADLLALGASIAYVLGSGVPVPDSEGTDYWIAGQEDTLEAVDDAINPLHHAEIDNLGRDLIVYWPGVIADQPTEETQP
jgi:hypothetical protein